MHQREAPLDPAFPSPELPGEVKPKRVAGANSPAYWRVIRRYWLQIIGLVVAVGLLAGLVADALEPVYQSSTTLLIDDHRAGFGPLQDDRASGWFSHSSTRIYRQTQILLLQSDALAEDVAGRLDLWNHPQFDPRQAAQPRAGIQPGLESLVPLWLRSEEAPASVSPDKARRSVVAALTAGVSAEQIPDSDIIRISFRSHDAELAARVAAGYAEAFIELGRETRLEQVRKAAAWVTSRLDALREQVESAELKLQSYREQHGLVGVAGAQGLADKELADLSVRLVEARARRDSLRHDYEQVQRLADPDSADLSAHPAVLRHPVIQSLAAEEVKAGRGVTELAERYGELHPKMVAARVELDRVRAKLQGEIANTIAGIKKDGDMAQTRVDQLQDEFDRLKSNAQEVHRKEFTLNALQRDVETNRQIYEMFLTRFEEADLGPEVESTNARVIDVARIQEHPIQPRKGRIIALGLLLALVLGIGLAILEDYLDSSIRSPEDVEQHTGLVNLGTVPLVGRRGVKRGQPEPSYLDSPTADFAEAIRTLRTGVVLSGLDDAHRVLLVTSSVPGEGKTTIAINLAVALSQLERVLLVDGDMRWASVGARLGLAVEAPGLSDLVAGTSAMEDCIQELAGTQLSVLPAGILPPNPLELLSSRRFAQTLEDLGRHYDRIVLDSAPAQAVSDALVLSRLCNAVVFVIAADATPRQLAQLAIRRLKRVNAPLIGAVLNRFDSTRAAHQGHYRFGRYRRYSYAYHGYTQYGGGFPAIDRRA